MLSIWFKKVLDDFTHFEIFHKHPIRDWSSFFVHCDLSDQLLHICIIVVNFSLETEMVTSLVSSSTPKQVTLVVGLTYFFNMISKLSFCSSVKRWFCCGHSTESDEVINIVHDIIAS